MADESYNRDEEGGSKVDPKTDQYIQELLQEKHGLDSSSNPHALRLLQEEINRVVEAGRGRPEHRVLDVLHDRTTKVVAKVLVPVRDHPRFNFVGKLLGPKGSTLKSLQEETQCRMSVLGRGSMKDRQKEEELRQGLDRKYAHLSDDLHVEISALAPPAEAHARIAYALAEIRKYLVPDTGDDISSMQSREMEYMGGDHDGYDQDGDNGYNNPAPRAPRGGRGGMRGGGRGASQGGNYGSFQSPARGGRGGNGGFRGGRGGRGGGGYVQSSPSAQINSYNRYDDDDGGQQQGGYSSGNQYTSAAPYEGVQRRPQAPSQQFEDRGQWKPQRGGTSRFSDRSAPYSRRT